MYWNLSYRAFTAHEEKFPIDPGIEHLERSVLREYKDKFCNLSLPDPLTIKNGWVGEKNGMSLWPKIFFMDISKYYLKVISRNDLWQRVACEYKEGKAYRYFANGFIWEVFINEVSKDSELCILKTRCVPSQRVKNKQHDVWCIIRKSSAKHIGGEIIAGYCTCTAGLLGMYFFFVVFFPHKDYVLHHTVFAIAL